MAYGDFEDLPRRTAADKVLRHKSFNLAKNLRHDGYQSVLASMVYKFFDQKTAGGVAKNDMQNKKSAEELHNQFEKRDVHPSFIDNIWCADIADMQLLSKFSKGIRFFIVYS